TEGLRQLPCAVARCGELPPGAPLEPRANDGKRKLVGEKLVMSQSRSGRRGGRDICLTLGCMKAPECVGKGRPNILRAVPFVHPFWKCRQPRQRLADRFAQRGVGQARSQDRKSVV